MRSSRGVEVQAAEPSAGDLAVSGGPRALIRSDVFSPVGSDEMRWRRDRSVRLQDVAERLTRRGLFRMDGDSASLDDRGTVLAWLRDMRPERDQQVLVHRRWGTIVAVADGRHPVGVFLYDGEKSWLASAPGAGEDQELTPDVLVSPTGHRVVVTVSPSRPGSPPDVPPP